MTTTSPLLHIWPGRWDLPSIDPACLEAVLYLQLAFPGHYSLVETADPDLSPTGQLPFLTHAQLSISTLPSITSYLSRLDPSLLVQGEPNYDGGAAVQPDLDAGLSALHLSQRAAWRAYIEAQLGDLVTHSFFVLDPNFRTFTHGLLASLLPIPQRYYVPRRIRESHRPRMEATGLWELANEPEQLEEERLAKTRKGEDREQTIRRAFGQAKLVEKARLVFDILANLLDGRSFVFDNRPTSIDLALASHILLLIKAPLPNPALKGLLSVSYPSLISHASRIYALAFPASPSTPRPQPAARPPVHVNPLGVLKSSLVHLTRTVLAHADESDETKRFRRYRWGWFALAVAGAVGYLATVGLPIVIIVPVKADGEERNEKTEEAVGVEELELVDEELLDETEVDDSGL